ncbi:hypothetical protein BH10BAC5_BH10BAC5_22970 [soil metagenome]
MTAIQNEFNTYLSLLDKEISLYKNEDHILDTTNITNSPGNLALHLCGNLSHYIGATLMDTGYVRDRDHEFSNKNVTRKELLNKISEVKEMMNYFFESYIEEKLKEIYPKNYFGESKTILDILFILAFHLSYHIGQIDYHRRINNF